MDDPTQTSREPRLSVQTESIDNLNGHPTQNPNHGILPPHTWQSPLPDNQPLQSSRLTKSENGDYISSVETLNNTTTAKEKDLEAGNRNPGDGNSKPHPKIVTWEGSDDPENPKNWKLSKKWMAAVTVSYFTFISPVSSSMIAPALSTIAKDFHVDNEIESQLMMSVFILAYAIGPLFVGPLSEIYGRVPTLQLANLVYLVFNIACGVCHSKGQMIAFRFLSGLGGSAPLAIGGGVIGDCFKPEERGKAIAIYSLAPLLGPTVAPIAGGFITENISWRWIFYVTSIADAIIQLFGLVSLRETYAPVLLERKARKLHKDNGDPEYQTEAKRSNNQTTFQFLCVSLVRPFKLLTTQPIIQFLALYMAFIYGLMYLVISTFPDLWTSASYYDESLGIGCLNYIALGVGFWTGSQFSAIFNDRMYRRLKKQNHDAGKPEFRLPLLMLAALITPIGLFIYGWTAQTRTFWIGPDIGACLFSMGIIVVFQCTQTYIVDAYTKYAASALAAVACLRSLAGFGFPLFAPDMYDALHYGWGNSLLAFVSIGIGIPAPFFLWKHGESLRKKSTYAAG
ncbi:MFS general substrate transporter [Aspergillus heteromorphus CBS 117.55]|uniref:MFS general substrate transporter n=1 Tax=Aspergillus heteromorphus CBS 117.55 TaxID=1448321 RepID=A0A317V5B8_9EURO|nr:MFS general substrate transporter [Aspergillus heteromorphus CBS 117.55]PWY68481.1 MFS general substrate transporter [Aspergillus heteromorphus CBS 117.55]